MCGHESSITTQLEEIPNQLTTPTKILSLLREKNFTEFVRTLNSSSFDVNHFYDEPDNGTLLDIACRSKGYREFVDILIEYGANINVINEKRGTAPIHEAVAFSDIGTLKILLKNGCDVNLVDGSGHTPILKAVFLARIDMLRILMEKNEVSLQPVEDQTILHAFLHGLQEFAGGSGVTNPDENDLKRKYCECLRYILYEAPRSKFDVTKAMLSGF
ncbi:uncharacterized protein LOC135836204 [Planococcus citri]|uniref:uncharacterized protein LOC135836204 n=1 Tax=Planococcus citri TaxID=170843 RepID=UPI0031F94C30